MNLDPKLVTAILTAAASWAVAKFALDVDDDTVAQVVALAAAAIAGYFKSNEATVLRTPQEDGNPNIPEEV